jgi:transcriptional regulator with XRE-family HTH domain
MSNFKERLLELMQDFSISQKKLEEQTGIPHSNTSDYINGKSMPAYTSLVKLLYFFNCSADYLLGKVEIPTEETRLPVLPFGKRLREILSAKGISQEKMKRDMRISGSVMYNWISGKREPSSASLIKIATYLDCSVDYLIGRLR